MIPLRNLAGEPFAAAAEERRLRDLMEADAIKQAEQRQRTMKRAQPVTRLQVGVFGLAAIGLLALVTELVG